MDREKVIIAVESCFDYWLVQHRCLHPLELENVQELKADALAMLKEQEAEAKWIYGEDKTGVDGWYCSECNFFEPWFYEFTEDIDFIRFYGHCPKCGRRMTSYTGKPTQERR